MTASGNTCRFCGNILNQVFADLRASPLANSYLNTEQLQQMEPFYSLSVYVCERCFLVQLPEVQSSESIFSDYAYFSSYSDSWLRHASDYVEMITGKIGLNMKSRVMEIASNDGYLLKYFMKKNIPVLGIEPARNVAEAAKEAGIPTVVRFFGVATASELSAEGKTADLLLGNNVLAHVPSLNDFVKGMKIILKDRGIITMEFPHLMKLIDENQFDTIYHEHFSYFSLITVQKIFAYHDLRIFDVEEIPTHGGSLRIYAAHMEDKTKSATDRMAKLLDKEESAGFTDIKIYASFNEKIKETKRNILSFLIIAKEEGKTVAGYGAPAKGNTLLNYCGIGTDFIDFTVDRSPHKQGKYLPGSRIPIFSPEKISEARPDYLLILPWNIRDEIMEQMKHIREWGGKFIIPIPEVKIV